MSDELDQGFTTGGDVDEPGNADIDVAQSQAEVDTEFEQLEQQLQAERSQNGSGATDRTPGSPADETTESETEDDGDFLEYARYCHCGASFRSKSAFNDHVDDVVNGTGVCSDARSTDGGVTVSTTTASTRPNVNPEKPDVPDLTTAEQLLKLEEDNRETFVTTMTLCQKVNGGTRPRRRTLKAIIGMDGPTYDELATIVDASKRTIRKYVDEFHDAGIVVRSGKPAQVVFNDWTMDVLAKHVLHLTE
jgi:hypothetical protein